MNRRRTTLLMNRRRRRRASTRRLLMDGDGGLEVGAVASCCDGRVRRQALRGDCGRGFDGGTSSFRGPPGSQHSLSLATTQNRTQAPPLRIQSHKVLPGPPHWTDRTGTGTELDSGIELSEKWWTGLPDAARTADLLCSSLCFGFYRRSHRPSPPIAARRCCRQ